jgi:hypothetical protein
MTLQGDQIADAGDPTDSMRLSVMVQRAMVLQQLTYVDGAGDSSAWVF